jgi:drug/metabolite transporter (DMT)-like permease
MEPAPRPAEARAGIAFAAGAAILYGAAYPATAIALRSFTPLAIAGLACTIALPVVIVLALAGVLPRPSATVLRPASLSRLIVLGLSGGLAFIAAVNVAVELSGSTVTGFVAPLYAVAASVLAVPILGERLRPVTVASLGLALVGTVLLAGGAPVGGSPVGVLLAGIAAVLFGLYIVLARRWTVPYALDGTSVTIASLIGRGPILLAIEAIRTGGEPFIPPEPDPAAVVALLTIAFGASSTANLMLLASVRRVEAGRTAAALLLAPVASALISAVILDERLTPIALAGAAAILLGIAGASGVWDRRPRRQAEAMSTPATNPDR